LDEVLIEGASTNSQSASPEKALKPYSRLMLWLVLGGVLLGLLLLGFLFRFFAGGAGV
jgi:hypothetical protein